MKNKEEFRIEVVLLAIAMWGLIQIPGMIIAFSFTNTLICLAVYAIDAILSFCITIFIINKILSDHVVSKNEQSMTLIDRGEGKS